MYREICQTDLSEFHPTVWEKSPEVSATKIYHAVWQILLYFYREFLSKILSLCIPRFIWWKTAIQILYSISTLLDKFFGIPFGNLFLCIFESSAYVINYIRYARNKRVVQSNKFVCFSIEGETGAKRDP